MTDWRDYEHTPSIELIDIIKMKDNPDHTEKAKAAFAVLCFRFEQSITKKAEVICSNSGNDKGMVIEIIERTFKKFWKYPKFTLEKMNTSTPEKGIELYLLRIAQNCFYDIINERNGINISPYDGNEEIIYEIPNFDETMFVNKERVIIIKSVLDSFSWKHKVIYLTYLKYNMRGHKLPRKLLIELRNKLELKQDTIRNYRFEVINKIIEYTNLWEQKERILTS